MTGPARLAARPIIAAWGVAALLTSAVAVGQTAPSASPSADTTASESAVVAVCDVTEVLRRDPIFTSDLDALRSKTEDLDRTFKQRLRQAETLREHALDFASGSAERRKLELEFAQTLATIQSDTAILRKELLADEAQIYYDGYLRVRGLIEEYSRTQPVTLVIRYQRNSPDGTDHHAVQDWVNSWIVYQGGTDLTDWLVGRLEATAQAMPRSGGVRAIAGRPPATRTR